MSDGESKKCQCGVCAVCLGSSAKTQRRVQKQFIKLLENKGDLRVDKALLEREKETLKGAKTTLEEENKQLKTENEDLKKQLDPSRRQALKSTAWLGTMALVTETVVILTVRRYISAAAHLWLLLTIFIVCVAGGVAIGQAFDKRGMGAFLGLTLFLVTVAACQELAPAFR